MTSNVYTVKIAGPAGTGIKSGGLLLANILVKHGFQTRDYSEYPSLVRGGHNTYQVSFSDTDFFAPHYKIDFFFSLLPKHWQQHEAEFTSKTLVLGEDSPNILPLRELVSEFGNPIYSNTICLGSAAFLLNLNPSICHEVITTQFGADNPNIKAFDIGYDYTKSHFSQYQIKTNDPKNQSSNAQVYDGNEAYSWGFLKAGGSFFAAYPMTPATGALHFLAKKQKDFDINVIHPEDEIAAASMACGAAFAGAKAATATSGGGFALMTESVSFAGAANLGVVFYLVSRPGPATGLPTWTGQSDLLFAVHAGHGEFNKIILAAGDQQESFDLSVKAQNLASEFNLPVILISDKYIAESSTSLSDLSKVKVNQVSSTKAIPGQPNHEYLANSYEHDEQGFSTEDPQVINKMVEDRIKQLQLVQKSVPKPMFFGSPEAKKLIVSWGSPKASILEALRLMTNSTDYAFLQLTTLWPINPDIKLLIKPFKDITIIENNATSQLTTLLKSQFDFNPTKTILKYDGRPFFPEELYEQLK